MRAEMTPAGAKINADGTSRSATRYCRFMMHALTLQSLRLRLTEQISNKIITRRDHIVSEPVSSNAHAARPQWEAHMRDQPADKPTTNYAAGKPTASRAGDRRPSAAQRRTSQGCQLTATSRSSSGQSLGAAASLAGLCELQLLSLQSCSSPVSRDCSSPVSRAAAPQSFGAAAPRLSQLARHQSISAASTEYKITSRHHF